MQHLDEGTIHAWIDGALSPAESERVAAHAAGCEQCAALVADARGMIAGAARIISALDDVPRGVLPKATTVVASRSLWQRLRFTPARAAIAAAALVMVSVTLSVRHKDAASTIVADSVTQGAAAPIAAAPVRMATPTAPVLATTPAAPAAMRKAAVVPVAQVGADSTRRAFEPRTQVEAIAGQAAKVAADARPVEDRAERVAAAPAAPPPPAAAAGGRAFAASSGANTAQLRAVRALEAAAPASGEEFAGCYQISESIATTSGLPRLFELRASTAQARDGALLATNVANASDSTFSGSWRQVSAALADLRFTRGTQPRSVMLSRGPSESPLDSLRGRVVVRATRVDCPVR